MLIYRRQNIIFMLQTFSFPFDQFHFVLQHSKFSLGVFAAFPSEVFVASLINLLLIFLPAIQLEF